MAEYFNIFGEQITQKAWEDLHKDPTYGSVGRDDLRKYTVSTEWQGVPDGYGPAGPYLFRTIRTNRDTGTVETYKSSTVEQARAIHKRLLTELKDEELKYQETRRWSDVIDESE